MIENNVGIGEIARYEQFLLFPQYFQKICLAIAEVVVHSNFQILGKKTKNVLENGEYGPRMVNTDPEW